ncbi:MAG: HAMP domain-containing protein, partial [Ignavibacteria bacterium]
VFLYKEISFFDKSGQEKLKIKNGQIVSGSKLKNISIPQNTTYKGETYFDGLKNLQPGQVYISHLNGFFVTPKEQFPEEEDAKNFDVKKYYDGVIRIITPKVVNGSVIGYVQLALDHIHLMEFTQHTLPNSKDKIVFPDYNSGDYAFMFDDEGWIITHPKFWDIRGFDNNGNPVPAYTKNTPKEIIEKGFIPFNLDSAGFIHPNYPLVASEIRKHNTGSVITKNVGGILKVMAYAPIELNNPPYDKFGIFGGITIGSEIHRFRGSAEIVANELKNKLTLFIDDLTLFVILTSSIIIIIAWFFSKSFSEPIRKLTGVVKKYADGDWDTKAEIKRNDEIGTLSDSFNVMAYELKKNREELLNSFYELSESKEQIEQYAGKLEYQLKIFSAIQKISNLLGTTFDFEAIIKEILRNCVEAIGYDRAILYLIDDEGKYLEYKDSFGFSPQKRKLASRSKYNLKRADCIETRVVRFGRIIFVEDFDKYPFATELDRKIHEIAESNSFVYVPLRAKEKIIGALGADKRMSGEKISEEDINSLQVLANQASRVIETTILYREIIKQRNFVKDIFDNMLNGIITTDGKGIITSFNNAAARILETNDNLVGKDVAYIFGTNSTLLEQITEKLDEQGSYNGYSLPLEINGKTKYLNLNITRTNSPTGEVESTIAVIQDQTERYYLEEHVRKVDRLVSLGKFAAAIAHEIRNPLTGISLFLDDLHDKIASDKNLSGLIQNSLEEINRLENLIEEILQFASPGKGIRKTANINELLERTIEFVRKEFETKKIKLIEEYKKDLPTLECEPDKLRQAFLNILLNAENAVDESGTVLIRTSVRKLRFYDSTETKNYLTVEFEDDGPGIAPEEKQQIFEPFFSKSPHGTGLGLSIVQTIISEHGGRIIAGESSFGGARFSIYFPI